MPPYTQKQKRYALRTWKLRYVNLPTWMNGKTCGKFDSRPVNSIIRDPVLRLKESALELAGLLFKFLCHLFALEDFLDETHSFLRVRPG